MEIEQEKELFENKKELFIKEKDNFEAEKRVIKKKSLNESLKAFVILLVIVIEFVVLWFILVKYDIIEDTSSAKNKIAVVYFDKVITYESVLDSINKIDKIIDDDDYKEILFIMNSPGGSPSASEELSEYLKGVTKDKNVTMYVGDYALSGGYYIASSIKPLYANKNALVGSIGVIMQYLNVKDLANKVGVKEVAMTKGKYKQPFSVFKDLDENMTNYINTHMLEPMYQNFIVSVATNRGVDFEKIKELAEGKIFLANSKNIQNILVDKVTSLYELKRAYMKKYGKDVDFVDILKEKNGFNLINGKVDLNLDSIKQKEMFY